jgi:hypothetical protein
VRDRLLRFISIADELQDNENERVRKRVGVIAGYVTVIAPLTAPLQARWNPFATRAGGEDRSGERSRDGRRHRQRRILFDLWGDTVNLAARMESSGVPGRIQVAPATRDLLVDTCAFEARDVEVKGIGPMTAYLVA